MGKVSAPFKIVQWNPEDADQNAFVYWAIAKRAQDWPYTRADEPYLRWLAERAHRMNPSGCVLAEDFEPMADGRPRYFGYVLTVGRSVVMAYTKMSLRGPGAFEAPVGTARDPDCPPVCSTLLEHLGFDIKNKHTSVQIWSAAATRIAERGYRIYPAVPIIRAKEETK